MPKAKPFPPKKNDKKKDDEKDEKKGKAKGKKKPASPWGKY